MTRRPVLRWITTSTRVLVGAGAAAATVVAVTLAIAFPWPTATTAPVRIVATPAPADTMLACDGPLLALGRIVEQAGTLSVAAAQEVVAGPDAADAADGTLRAPAPEAAPLTFTAPAREDAAALFAASGAASVAGADLRGFAASGCRTPLLESWLVGGATTTGANDLVILGNPGSVPATVQLTVYGASGPQTAPGGIDRVVPAGQQVVVPLAGLLPAEASPVVRVTATGAPVTASLQTSLVRTLVPGGVDQVSPVAAAAAVQVIPGVTVVAPSADAQGAATILRVLSPTADAQAQVSVRDESGRAVGEPVALPLAAGIPTELELGSLAAGSYTVAVDADAPVVAAVWSTSGFGEGADFAWYAPAPLLPAESVVAVPAGSGARLVLVGGSAPATAVLTAPDGSETELEVAADGVVERALAAPGAYRLTATEPLRAGVSFAATGALAGFPVWGADAAAPPIVVYP